MEGKKYRMTTSRRDKKKKKIVFQSVIPNKKGKVSISTEKQND